MAEMPRIITVDPTGNISRTVRSAMDILDLSIIQVDTPFASHALEELARRANLVVSAFAVGEEMKGFELAMRVKKDSPDTAVLILGDVDDPDEFDQETAEESPYIYMSRPIDIHRFLRVLVAGLESQEAMFHAMYSSGGGGTSNGGGVEDMGVVPALDIDAATGIVDSLLTDLGAMAIVLTTRAGETLLERGAVGYINRDELAQVLLPVMKANIGIKDMVGGDLSSVQLYDGDNYDIFVLTVGLHHVMAVVFDGTQGSRQFGMVIRFGRKAVEDLIAIIGANAFFIQHAQPQDTGLQRRSVAAKKARVVEEEEPMELARAEITKEEVAEPEPAIHLEAISDDAFDLDDLFGDDFAMDEDMFDLDKMEELAKSNTPQRKGALSWDEAGDLGILPG